MATASTADHIAETAALLFYRYGIANIGVDRVAADAGRTKRTLYRHFRSKEALVAAALLRAPRIRFPNDGTPRERLLGVFDRLEAFLVDSQYRGCPYIVYTAELTDPRHAARRCIEGLVAKRRAWFADRANEAGFGDPQRVAEQLDVIFDGALASGAKRGDLVAVRAAREIAALVLRAASDAKAEAR